MIIKLKIEIILKRIHLLIINFIYLFKNFILNVFYFNFINLMEKNQTDIPDNKDRKNINLKRFGHTMTLSKIILIPS